MQTMNNDRLTNATPDLRVRAIFRTCWRRHFSRGTRSRSAVFCAVAPRFSGSPACRNR